jgi:hypothetical protein
VQFNILTLQIWRPSPEDAPRRGDKASDPECDQRAYLKTTFFSTKLGRLGQSPQTDEAVIACTQHTGTPAGHTSAETGPRQTDGTAWEETQHTGTPAQHTGTTAQHTGTH